MTIGDWRYYIHKMIFNSWVSKTICASFVAFFSIQWWESLEAMQVIFVLRVRSMIFGTINGTIKHNFNIRKFVSWWSKIIAYFIVLYCAYNIDKIMTVWRLEWIKRYSLFVGFMAFDLILSIMKHSTELGIPMPTRIVEFIKKQETIYYEKHMKWKENMGTKNKKTQELLQWESL